MALNVSVDMRVDTWILIGDSLAVKEMIIRRKIINNLIIATCHPLPAHVQTFIKSSESINTI